MKRVIDGKIYNTETATRIGFTEFGCSGDHRYRREALFKTPRGRYFLEYTGGALSRYAVDHGPNLVGGSSGIRVLDEADALAWCESAGFDADTIAAHFGDAIEEA